MFESHFGFSGPPFQLNADPAFFFGSRGPAMRWPTCASASIRPKASSWSRARSVPARDDSWYARSWPASSRIVSLRLRWSVRNWRLGSLYLRHPGGVRCRGARYASKAQLISSLRPFLPRLRRKVGAPCSSSTRRRTSTALQSKSCGCSPTSSSERTGCCRASSSASRSFARCSSRVDGAVASARHCVVPPRARWTKARRALHRASPAARRVDNPPGLR